MNLAVVKSKIDLSVIDWSGILYSNQADRSWAAVNDELREPVRAAIDDMVTVSIIQAIRAVRKT